LFVVFCVFGFGFVVLCCLGVVVVWGWGWVVGGLVFVLGVVLCGSAISIALIVLSPLG